MRAWNFDASHSKDDDLANFVPIDNPDIREFLSQENTTKTILVATKGLGKTLLLKKKAAELRRQYHEEGSVIIHPSNGQDIVEHLRITGLFDENSDWRWIRRFNSPQQWSDLWEYAIGFLVCRNEGLASSASIEAKDALERIHRTFCSLPLGESTVVGRENVRDYFTAMATSWDSRANEFTELYVNHAAPVLSRLTRLHILFLDSPDESIAFSQARDESENDEVTQSKSDWWALYPVHWVNFNIGFIDAIRRVQQKNGNIRVFGCLRVEALNAGTTPLMAQYEAMIIRLRYSRVEMRAIFTQNIDLMRRHPMDKVKLVTQVVSEQPILDFLGIAKALHEPTGQQEDIFEAILRHTRNTPRDLVRIGGALAGIPVEDRKACTEIELDCIRTVINEQAYTFLQQQKNESIPLWKGAVFPQMEALCTNLISRAAIRHLSPLTKRQSGGCPFDFLYAQGILGWLGRSTAGNKERINFLDGQKVSTKSELLPESQWYALHPIAYGHLRNVHGDGWRNKSGFLSSAKAIVASGAEITLPSVLRVEANQNGGTIYITGLRVLKVPITHNGASILLAILVYHATQKCTLEFALDSAMASVKELKEKFKWVPDMTTNTGRESSVTNDDNRTSKIRRAFKASFEGSHDETSQINLWLAVAFGFYPASDFDFQRLARRAGSKSFTKNRLESSDAEAKQTTASMNSASTTDGGRLQQAVRLRWKTPILTCDGLNLNDISWSAENMADTPPDSNAVL